MKKRICVFLVLIFVMLGISACSKSPYDKMKLTLDKTEINLTLSENDNVLSGDSQTVTVRVDAPRNISKDIVLPTYGEGYGNEFVDISVSGNGSGTHTLTITPIKQGYTEIQIKTYEGYVSKTLAINIDVAITELHFKSDANAVVEIGGSFDFNVYYKSLLDFVPAYTTQTNVRFEIVNPNSYKDTIDGVETQLVSLDARTGVLSIHPKANANKLNDLRVVALSNDNDSVFTADTMPIRVISTLKLNDPKVLNLQLRDVSKDKIISLSNVSELSTVSDVYYEIVFASPDAELNQEDIENNIDQMLIFGGNIEMTLTSGEYSISYTNEHPECVTIAEATTNKANNRYLKGYNLSAKEVGEYTARFKVDYVGRDGDGKQYGISTKYINVKISVVALPTSKTIMINEQNYLEGQNIISVFDSYASGSGSRLQIKSTNNPYMTYKVSELAGVYPINANEGESGIIASFNNNPINPRLDQFISGSTLYLQNKTGMTDTTDLRITLSTEISNDYYSENQIYTKTINVKLNLITGLTSLMIPNTTLNIVDDQAGAQIVEFNDGVIASSVVESVRYGDNRLFTYAFGEGVDNNKIFVYPTQYVPGSDTLYEGATNFIVELVNGVRSYNADGTDTIITVKATYQLNGVKFDDDVLIPDEIQGKNIVITKIDDKNEGFLAYSGIADDPDYSIQYGDPLDDYIFVDYEKDQHGVTYQNFESVILSTYSEIDFDLYKLFVYVDSDGKKQIGYVNANSLRVEIYRDGNYAYDYVQWADGKLSIYDQTTYDIDEGKHIPIEFKIYNADENADLFGVTPDFTIKIYICKRIGKIALEKKHFDLYDGTDDNAAYKSLNSVYNHLSEANLDLKIWEIAANGTLVEDDDIVLGEYGNLYRFYTMIGEDDKVSNDINIARKSLLTLDESRTHLKAGLTASIPGEPISVTLARIYETDRMFSYDGRVRQFNQEFVIDFSVNVSYVKKANNISTNVDDEIGIYFEQDDNDKIYKFNYTIYAGNVTFQDLFIEVITPDPSNPYANVVLFNNEYKKDADGNYILSEGQRVRVYKSYTTEGYGLFDPKLYSAGIRYDDGKYTVFDSENDEYIDINEERNKIVESYNIAGQYFYFQIGTDGTINFRTNYTTPGSYIVRVNTVDSYSDADHEFKVFDEFNVYIADGSVAAPYQIRSTRDFETFLKDRNNAGAIAKHYVFATDVYLNRAFTNDLYSIYLNKPLYHNLSGQFLVKDSNGYREYNRKIYGLNILLNDIVDITHVGLFTSLQDVSMRYINLENVSITVNGISGNSNVNIGALVAELSQGSDDPALENKRSIVGARVNGSIFINNATNTRDLNVGGIVGKYTGGVITGIPDDRLAVNNSDINSTIKIEYSSNRSANLGGIAGYIGSGATLSDVRAIASIVAKNTYTDENANYVESNIGGIAGVINNATIDNVISYPVIIGHSNIGGIVGTMTNSKIQNSQVQLLYNINIKNVIAGLNKVGGVAGLVSDKNSTISYTYVRSYTTKTFLPFSNARPNIEFYQDFGNKYYGSIVLLNGVSGAMVGGMIGNGYATLNNSNFMSNVVSYNTGAKIGAIVGSVSIKIDSNTTLDGEIDLTRSYVDGKIMYYDHAQSRYYNSFNIITAPDSTTQQFVNGTGNVSTTCSIEGSNYESVEVGEGEDKETKTSYNLSERNSYIVITQTNTVSNSVMEYSDLFKSFAANQFYARVNNTLFGFVANGVSTVNTFSYRSFSDKTEKITIVIYNDGTQLRMYARSQTYENSPSGVTYTNNLLGKLASESDPSQYGNKLPIWGKSDSNEYDSAEIRYTSQQLSKVLIGLGMYTDTDRYYYSVNIPATTSYLEDELYNLIVCFTGIGGGSIDTSYTTNSDSFEDVAKECQILVSSDPSNNINELRIIESISASEISVNIRGANSGTITATFDKQTSKGDNYKFEFNASNGLYQCISDRESGDLKNVRLLATDYRSLTKTSYRTAKIVEKTVNAPDNITYNWTHNQFVRSGIYTDGSGADADKYFYMYNASTSKAQLFKLKDESSATASVTAETIDDALYYNNDDGKFYQLAIDSNTGDVVGTVVEYSGQFVMFSDGTNYTMYKLDLTAEIPAHGIDIQNNNIYFQPEITMVYLAESYILNENLESVDGSYKVIGDSIYYNNEKVENTNTRYYKLNYATGLSITNTAVTTDKIASTLYSDKNQTTLQGLLGYGSSDYIDGEIKVTHEGTTYYRYGNDWYSDSDYTQVINETYILNQLGDSKTNAYYEVIRTAYYKDGDWYKDSECTDRLVYYNQGDQQYYQDTNYTIKMDLSIMNQLIGKTEDTKYYVKRDVFYDSSQPKYFTDNNGGTIVIGIASLISSLNFGNSYVVDKQFDYENGVWKFLNGVNYIPLDSTNDAGLISYLESMKQGSSRVTIKIYRTDWKDINNNPIYDVNGLEQLKGKNYNTTYNVMQLAYYLDNWYTDPNYVDGKVDSVLAKTLRNSAQEYNPQVYINDFTMVVNGEICEFDFNIDTSTTLNDFTNVIASHVTGNFGITIKNNVLYVITQNGADNRVIDTMIINDELHYVVGKAQIQADVQDSSKRFADWLINSKINNNLPVFVKVNYNLDAKLVGDSYEHGMFIATYSLYYDELATLSLKANEFTPLEGSQNPNNDYISGDTINPHGHIKVDETSVVLMYNKAMGNLSKEEQIIAESANKYKISFGEQDGHYVAVLNGIVVDLSGIHIDKENALQLFITSSDNTVVSIERDLNSNNFIVTVKNEGEAEINFYNLKDDGIKATLKVYVIKGFTNFEMYDASSEKITELNTIVGSNPSDYMFRFVNKSNNLTFQANNGGFRLKLISIDGNDAPDKFNNANTYSEIKVNNFYIDKSCFLSGEVQFDFDSPNLSFLALNQTNTETSGVMVFEVIPYVICAGQTVYVQELKRTVTLNITNPAQEIHFSETNSEQLPDESKSVTVSIYSNYDSEKLILKVVGDDWSQTYHEISSSYEMICNSDSLLQFRLMNYGCEQVELGGVKMYLHTYTMAFSMNKDVYLQKTLNSGQNAIASSKHYTFVAYPSSWCTGSSPNTDSNGNVIAISDTYYLTINPVTANKIATAFYPYLTAYDNGNQPTNQLDKIESYQLDQIYEISALPPDRFGLLKIEINPKFNNTLIVQAEIEKQYVGLIQFKQIVSIPYTSIGTDKYGYYKVLASASNSNINISNIYTLWDAPYKMTSADNFDDGSDIEYNQEWILSEYYLAVFVQPNCPQGINIPITIRAFDDKRNEILTDVVDLFIEPIPHVSITIDNEKKVIRGVDEYIPLQIQADNVDADALKIEICKVMENSSSDMPLPLYTYNSETKVYTEVPDNKIVPGGEYYLRTLLPNNYEDTIGNYSITVSTSKDIHGVEFAVSDSANIQIVWLTIESVAERDVISNVVTMKTGMFKGLSVVVDTNKTKDGRGINAFDSIVGSKINLDGDSTTAAISPNEYLEYLQNSIAGRNEFETSYWYYNNNGTYTYLSKDGAAYNNFMFSRYDGSGSNAGEGYFRISAIQIGTIKFRLSFHYKYNDRGIVEISSTPDNTGTWFVIDYEFTINIKENSSEDHPLPIFDVDDLMNMESGSNYILQADLTLSNWEPIPFNSKYLDGNGFTISIQSFNTFNIKGKDEAYVGLFTHIAEGSTIKNLNINIAELLYGDNTLDEVRNNERTPNIDLRETPTVYFGVLAGENLGTIINTKIVNMDGRKNNATLYVGITRGYFSYGEESMLTQGYIGGLVAQNSGVITNSYIGLNKLEQIERTVSSTTEFTTILSYIYPFKLEACNNVAGFVYTNGGTITNSYVKSVSIVNSTRVSDGGSTAGFVGINSGEIYSAAVTDTDIDKFKAKYTTITSSSMTGGFVYNNSGVIEDSYTTVQISNQNVATAGFVYDNADGSIKNSYTTTKNTSITSGTGNTESHGLFTYEKSEYGTIENCFYLILDNELGSGVNDAELLRAIDPAHAIIKSSGDKLTVGEFPGFSFASSATDYDGIWYLANEGATFPELSFAENVDYFSLRQLVNISTTYFKADVVDVDTKHTADVSMEVYQDDDGSKKVLEKYNNLTRKTNVWYFSNGNKMFEVVGNTILEVNSHAEMAVETKVSGEHVYFDFSYDGVSYKVYYGNSTDYGIKINIDGVDKRIANYCFTYLGFEFIVIREHNIELVSGVENVESCNVSFKMITNNGFNIITMANVTGKTNEFVYGGNSTYSYVAIKNNIGSKYNPIIVTNSEEFARYIVSNTNEYVLSDNRTRSYVFGLTENTGDGVYARYIHLANNIDFKNDGENTDINIATKYEVNNSTAMITINDVIFNGVIIGNSMGINNIILNSKEVRDNYGIFNEVGVNDALRYELSSYAATTNIPTAQVFNLKLQYLELSNSSANKVGLLAGTISNAVINKVDIEGVNTIDDESQIIGQNLTGALAGLIYGKDGSTKVSEITISNANISSVVNQLSNFNSATIASSQKYDRFKDSGTAVETEVKEITFGSYVDLNGNTQDGIRVITNLDNSISEPSYAGAIAGAIIIDTEIKEDTLKRSALDNYSSYDALRTNSTYFYIKDLKVMDMINIQADVSGGIAGYIGARDNDASDPENVLEYGVFISDLLLEIEDAEQQNIFGYGYAGGLVGQTKNAYIIQSQVTHTQEVQDEIDKKINEITSDKISSSLLFSKNKSTTEYNIGIGGFVGRMHNTWVVDSMSKVNVENQNSFIAGGIAGFVTGSNYLAYVYTTGNVLAKNMIGGLVGYYYIDEHESYNLNLYNAFAVNVWNKNIKDLLAVNEEAYRYEQYNGSNWEKISDIDKGFMGSFNSMPELGNQQTSRARISGARLNLKLLDKYVANSNIEDETVKVCDSNDNVIYTFRFFNDGDERDVTYQGYTFKLIWNAATGVACEKVTLPEDEDEKTSYYSVDYSSKQITITPYVRIAVDNEYVGFAAYERFTFIGSVMGRVSQYKVSKNQDILSHIDFYDEFGMANSGSMKGVINDATKALKQIVSRTNISVSGENEEYYTYYNAYNFNVISSTYGMVEHEGSISEGNYESIIAEDKVNLSYFKSSYACADTLYNSYNIDNFSPMFGKQYYISYITGDYINNSSLTSIGNKYYVNEFSEYYGFTFNVIQKQPIAIDGFNYERDMYLSDINLDKINERIHATVGEGETNTIKSLSIAVASLGFDTSMTWYVDHEFYLAKYGYNSNSTFVLIDNEAKLYEALTDGKSGMMYRIDFNKDHGTGGNCATGGTSYEYHVNNVGTNENIIRYNITNNIYFASTVTKIKFAPGNSTGIVNLFDVITSSTFMNLSFIVDLNDVNSVQTSSLDNSFGFFANTIVSSVFENCSFTFTQTAGSLSVSPGTGDSYVSKIGFVAGMASNTVFQGCPVDYDIDSAIEVQHNVIQFGGYVGHSFQSTFVHSSITGNLSLSYDDEMQVGLDEMEHNFGGFIGEAQSSRIQSIIYQGTFNVTTEDLQSTTYNFGIFIGKAHGSCTIFDIDVFKYVLSGTADEYSVSISAKENKTPTVNIGIFGQIDSITSLENIKGMVNSAPQFDDQFNYVSFGDSISRGMYLEEDPVATKGELSYEKNLQQNNGMVPGSYVQQFADYLENKCDGKDFTEINAINYAKDGDQTSDLLTKIRTNANIRRDLMKADVISISIGANDLLHILDLNDENQLKKLASFILLNDQSIIQDLVGSISENTRANIPLIIEEINKLNPYAQVYFSTIYNPFKGLLDTSLGNYCIEAYVPFSIDYYADWIPVVGGQPYINLAGEMATEVFNLNSTIRKIGTVAEALLDSDSIYNNGSVISVVPKGINQIIAENIAPHSNYHLVDVKAVYDASFEADKSYNLVNVELDDIRKFRFDAISLLGKSVYALFDDIIAAISRGYSFEGAIQNIFASQAGIVADWFGRQLTPKMIDPHPNSTGHNLIATTYRAEADATFTVVSPSTHPSELKINLGNSTDGEGSGNSTVNAGAIGMVRGGRGLTIRNFDNRLGMNVVGSYIDDRTILSIGGLIGNKSGTSKVNLIQCVNYGVMNINSESDAKLTINAGGFVGRSAGMIIQQSVNLAKLKINSNHETGYVSFGGIIGSNSSGSITLNNVINYGDLEFKLQKNKEYKIGGLVGNVGDRALTTNYTLALGNNINNHSGGYLQSKESLNGFAHNYRELSNMNSHYIAEHDPRTAYNTNATPELNYKVDNIYTATEERLLSIAWQYIDVMKADSSNDSLSAASGNLIKWKSGDGSVLPIVDGLKYRVVSSDRQEGSKHNPKTVTTLSNTTFSSTNKYIIVSGTTAELTGANSTIPAGTILTSANKAGTNVKVNSYNITTNSGVISNIKFVLTMNSVSSSDKALVIGTNNGSLMNVGISNNSTNCGIVLTSSAGGKQAPILTNNGGIYATGTMYSLISTLTVGGTTYTSAIPANTELSYMTHTNNGEILNSYTTSDADAVGSATINLGAIAYTNNGSIKNVFFGGTAGIVNSSDDIVVAVNYGYFSLVFEGTRPDNAFSDKNRLKPNDNKDEKKSAGNKKTADMKTLIADGYLSNYLWETGNWNKELPYIKGGIELRQVFGDNATIRNIPDYNAWVMQIQEDFSGINTRTITFDINDFDDVKINEIDSDSIISNSGTINIKNIRGLGQTKSIAMPQSFINENTGSIQLVEGGVGIKGLEIYNDESSDNCDFVTTNKSTGTVTIKMDTCKIESGYIVKTNEGTFTVTEIKESVVNYFMNTSSGTTTITMKDTECTNGIIESNNTSSLNITMESSECTNIVKGNNSGTLTATITDSECDTLVSGNNSSTFTVSMTETKCTKLIGGENIKTTGKLNIIQIDNNKGTIEINKNSGEINFDSGSANEVVISSNITVTENTDDGKIIMDSNGSVVFLSSSLTLKENKGKISGSSMESINNAFSDASQLNIVSNGTTSDIGKIEKLSFYRSTFTVGVNPKTTSTRATIEDIALSTSQFTINRNDGMMKNFVLSGGNSSVTFTPELDDDRKAKNISSNGDNVGIIDGLTISDGKLNFISAETPSGALKGGTNRGIINKLILQKATIAGLNTNTGDIVRLNITSTTFNLTTNTGRINGIRLDGSDRNTQFNIASNLGSVAVDMSQRAIEVSGYAYNSTEDTDYDDGIYNSQFTIGTNTGNVFDIKSTGEDIDTRKQSEYFVKENKETGLIQNINVSSQKLAKPVIGRNSGSIKGTVEFDSVKLSNETEHYVGLLCGISEGAITSITGSTGAIFKADECILEMTNDIENGGVGLFLGCIQTKSTGEAKDYRVKLKELTIANSKLISSRQSHDTGLFVGLVGNLDGAIPMQLTINEMKIENSNELNAYNSRNNFNSGGNSGIGGVVGYAYDNAEITLTGYANSTINTTKDNTYNIGGIVGFFEGKKFNYNDGNVTSSSVININHSAKNVGGIFGRFCDQNYIYNSSDYNLRMAYSGTIKTNGKIGYNDDRVTTASGIYMSITKNPSQFKWTNSSFNLSGVYGIVGTDTNRWQQFASVNYFSINVGLIVGHTDTNRYQIYDTTGGTITGLDKLQNQHVWEVKFAGHNNTVMKVRATLSEWGFYSEVKGIATYCSINSIFNNGGTGYLGETCEGDGYKGNYDTSWKKAINDRLGMELKTGYVNQKVSAPDYEGGSDKDYNGLIAIYGDPSTINVYYTR